MKTPKQIVMEWAVVFNGYDAAAAAALYHYDATNIQVARGEPVQGRQAMLDTFTAILRAFPDSHTEIEHISRMASG
jgi:ketosteroid isomerase-like protein